MDSLTKTMKQHEISGTEAMMGIRKFISLGFFGEGVKNTWIGESIKHEEKGIENRSCIILNQTGREEFYVLDGASMIAEELSKEELIERFNSGRYVYRDNDHTIDAIKDFITTSNESIEVEVDK